METTRVLQYEPFQSAVDTTFWHSLAKNKIDIYKLDDESVPIQGFYSSGGVYSTVTTDKNKGMTTTTTTTATTATTSSTANVSTNVTESLPSRLCISSMSFSKLGRQPDSRSFIAPGTLKNTNTIEDFKSIDKSSLLKTISLEPVRSFVKAYGADMLVPFQTEFDRFRTVSASPGYFLAKMELDVATIVDVSEYDTFFKPGDEITLGFVDPSGLLENPGWPLRNFLALISYRWKPAKVTIICYRESSKRRDDISATIVIDVCLSAFPDEPKCVGWEKGITDKLTPRVADLAPMMDPVRLADTAVDLNLKLMRWRILPELQLEAISQKKCLLLGAGTLGCYVSRLLMAWGVRNITFVDSGKVSFSNPVRQPLFKFEDCFFGGKSKAHAAAAALKEVFPGVNAVGVGMNIPMPGHSIQAADVIKRDIAKIEELISSHDVVFLLTDSRESRWLPTLLGASMGKIVLNAALGFDTFLVMRHGMRGDNPHSHADDAIQLGCYYCSDVVAPTDSLTDRTLDQQCTVTRPGLSSIASALVVELLSSIVNHPHGSWAAAVNQADVPGSSVLGAIPHQIRGYLGQFSNVLVAGHAYDKCPACSKVILEEYKKMGHTFLLKGLSDPKYLEDLSGLTELQNLSNDLDIEWDDEGDI
ncbi:E1-like protein-activating enzyme Gsa7p/Apg7p [Batrachochytrium salamandrivorans]|nr:E1-like protein-activating enzyme Gsa7p/Apg7p [Batrachochytrium salamandrivorans]